ncbi:hypothetical protein [Haloarcula marina]|uniref:hypothetical protein n=1 Tax=Haloarcula marina TaxID=2961574 RepID=UPI0020B718AA|nr:hypothetical protein [Halomicroarcula marina]
MTSHQTENRSYNLPQEGDADWETPVNENWEQIDADIQAVFDTVDAVWNELDNDAGGN